MIFIISIFIFWIYFWNAVGMEAKILGVGIISIFIFWIYFWNRLDEARSSDSSPYISIFIFWIYFWNKRALQTMMNITSIYLNFNLHFLNLLLKPDLSCGWVRPPSIISIFIFWIYFWNHMNHRGWTHPVMIGFQSSFSESTFETHDRLQEYHWGPALISIFIFWIYFWNG